MLKKSRNKKEDTTDQIRKQNLTICFYVKQEIYIWFLSQILAQISLKPWGGGKTQTKKKHGISWVTRMVGASTVTHNNPYTHTRVSLNETSLGWLLDSFEMGTDDQQDWAMIWGLELSAPDPVLWGEKGAADWIQ